MISRTNYQVSFAHLTSRVKQVVVAMLSVTFGISMYIFMNSFMTGVNDIQTELAFSTLAHIRVYNDLPEDQTNLISSNGDDVLVNLRNPKVIQYTNGIRNSMKELEALKHQPGIRDITPQVNINVFFRNGATKVNGVVSGINAITENDLFKTSESVIEGSWFDLENRNDGIIIGVGLAQRLSVGLSDQVVISTSEGVTMSFKVIGVIETSLANVDNAKAFMKIKSARQLASKRVGYATDIQINVHDFNEAEEIADRLARLTEYSVEAWSEANGQLEAGSALRDYIAIAVSLTILIVAGFGIYNIMNMTVNEKIKEIAILKAMGFQGSDIVQIFLVQSIIIGVIGGFFGLIIGLTVSLVVNEIPFEIGGLETLPMAYYVSDYISAFAFGLVTTFIAGYLPAKKASLVDPVSIIRG